MRRGSLSLKALVTLHENFCSKRFKYFFVGKVVANFFEHVRKFSMIEIFEDRPIFYIIFGGLLYFLRKGGIHVSATEHPYRFHSIFSYPDSKKV